MIKIKNISPTGFRRKYMVFRQINNENWFFEAYDSVYMASCICAKLGDNCRICESKDAYPEDM